MLDREYPNHVYYPQSEEELRQLMAPCEYAGFPGAIGCTCRMARTVLVGDICTWITTAAFPSASTSRVTTTAELFTCLSGPRET